MKAYAPHGVVLLIFILQWSNGFCSPSHLRRPLESSFLSLQEKSAAHVAPMEPLSPEVAPLSLPDAELRRLLMEGTREPEYTPPSVPFRGTEEEYETRYGHFLPDTGRSIPPPEVAHLFTIDTAHPWRGMHIEDAVSDLPPALPKAPLVPTPIDHYTPPGLPSVGPATYNTLNSQQVFGGPVAFLETSSARTVRRSRRHGKGSLQAAAAAGAPSIADMEKMLSSMHPMFPEAAANPSFMRTPSTSSFLGPSLSSPAAAPITNMIQLPNHHDNTNSNVNSNVNLNSNNVAEHQNPFPFSASFPSANMQFPMNPFSFGVPPGPQSNGMHMSWPGMMPNSFGPYAPANPFVPRGQPSTSSFFSIPTPPLPPPPPSPLFSLLKTHNVVPKMELQKQQQLLANSHHVGPSSSSLSQQQQQAK
eukprot:GILJ01007137.1.p1 GENE.GILJ01007137.1~~GILJ01007137.1.p1  ORF type:complete len:438 (+),score=68.40 GILJ01007137.1:64-1314(+)